MLELANHILSTKAGEFDPAKFDDRYDAALAALVQAKISGKKIVPLRPPKPTKANDLLEALRLSAGVKADDAPKRSSSSRKSSGSTKSKAAKKTAARSSNSAPRRKAS
jgi:DNA end-binding protein Ku